MTADISKIRIPFNLVLVKLNPDFDTYQSSETGSETGISVAPWGINQASHVAVTGIVAAVPENLIYNGYQLAEMKHRYNNSKEYKNDLAALRRESMSFDVPMEIGVGMTVYFEYLTRLDAIEQGRIVENEDDRYIFVPYDQLILTFRGGCDMSNVQLNDIYPLNGFLIVKPLEFAVEKIMPGISGTITDGGIILPASEKKQYIRGGRDGKAWYGSIIASGSPVKHYRDFPGRGGERFDKNIKPGMKILYDGRHQKRLEVEHHRVIVKQHTLFRIHPKDIYCFYPDGNINGMPVV